MAKQKSLEYETKSKFNFRDDPEQFGEYTIWADRIETTCRRCKTQHQVSDKFAAKARTNNNILTNALCINCFLEEKEIERGLEKDAKETNYSNRAGVGQAINLAALTGKHPKDIKNLDELVEAWIVFCEDKQQEYNG
jgi:hypothetical protein